MRSGCDATKSGAEQFKAVLPSAAIHRNGAADLSEEAQGGVGRQHIQAPDRRAYNALMYVRAVWHPPATLKSFTRSKLSSADCSSASR
jgi:hypothetical protein